MLAYIGREAERGNRVYFVCPKIEGDEEGELASVTELYEELCARLPRVRFALLHGKMKDAQKAQTVADFRDGKTDCLVTTTVIEVGIDVPDATIMVITTPSGSDCRSFISFAAGSGAAKRRAIVPARRLRLGGGARAAHRLQKQYGRVKIAEEDLKLRGGGDFLGVRQSGHAIADIRNLRYPPEVIFTAKKLADEAAGTGDTARLRQLALQKYEKLKEIVLN